METQEDIILFKTFDFSSISLNEIRKYIFFNSMSGFNTHFNTIKNEVTLYSGETVKNGDHIIKAVNLVSEIQIVCSFSSELSRFYIDT